MTKLVIKKVTLKTGDVGRGAMDGRAAGVVPMFVADVASGVRVKAYHYPQCCTGAILSDFGGSYDSYGRTKDVVGVKAEIQAWIEAIQEGILGQTKSFISACTTEQQQLANAALLELGFVPSKSIINEVNDFGLITWTFAIDGWEEL
tara:strand:+ start:2990 stop:3430 length:441 start_codon:yes stop_codon:yes gene_type:complete